MYKKTNKIIASMIVFIMMLTHFSVVGNYASEVFAANSSIINQTSVTKHKNVEFDTYFVEGESKTYEATKNIGEENKIIAQISVKEAGYLKNAKVEFLDANFNIINAINSIKVANVNENNISLNQIDAGEDIRIEIPFTFEHDEKISTEEFNKINTVKFTATYIDEKGHENKIEKEILIRLKWTANAEAILESEILKYVSYDIKGQKGLVVQTSIKSFIKDNLLPIKENNIEVTIPKINEVLPKEINVYSKNTAEVFDKNNYSYDDEKLTIKIQNNNSIDGNISWKNEIDEYIVTYIQRFTISR